MSDPAQHYETAVVLHRQGKLAEAERHYRAALDHPGALQGLGVLLVHANRFEEAAEVLRRAADAAPRDATVRHQLGLVLLRLGRFEEAARSFEEAVALDPGHRGALTGLGDALSILGRPAEAKRAYERLLALDPDAAIAHFGIGTAMKQQGRFAEARAAFERAVALAPRVPAFHRALAETGRFVPDDPRLAALEELAADEAKLPDGQKVELAFALFKAHDDLGHYDRAFAHLEKGNALKRHLVDYDEAMVMAMLLEIAAAFTPEVMEAKRGAGHPAELPVFVVGMPRSGTSLVEQILASHPRMFGAGERTIMGELIADRFAGDYPAGTASLTPDALSRFGALYAERLAALAPEAARIIDKLPGNFRHLGLIHLALPQARIIHVRRDARDTCFSCYTKLFLTGLDYTYDLGELGRHYKAYEALMAHWRALLPSAALLDVSYEALVENFETEARRMLAFCGLEWDDHCLRFHETERAVRTLSDVQVRQPLFTSSIGRWRPYAEWLGPLFEALR